MAGAGCISAECACAVVGMFDGLLVAAWRARLQGAGSPALSAVWGHEDLQSFAASHDGRQLLRSRGTGNIFFAGMLERWRCSPLWLARRLFRFATCDTTHRILGPHNACALEQCPMCNEQRSVGGDNGELGIIDMPFLSPFRGRLLAPAASIAQREIGEEPTTWAWAEATRGHLPVFAWTAPTGSPMFSSFLLQTAVCHGCQDEVPARSYILGTDEGSP